MKLLKDYRFLGILIFLGAFYFFLRFFQLDSLPIFTDEAIYIRWAQIGGADPNWRFISLIDGKQPLFVWFIMASIRFINDPLFAGRLISVVSGFFTLIGIYFLSRGLFKNRIISLLSALFYIVYPFAQVYDRMALMDGMVGTFAVWAIYFSVLLIRKLRLDLAYTLGFVIGGAAITKSSGFLSAYMLPFTLLLFDFKQRKTFNRLVKWVFLAGFAFLISQGIYNLLRLSPFFYIIALKNASFVYPISEWIKHPFTYFLDNLGHLLDWAITYLTPAYLVLIAISFLSLRLIKEKSLLFLYFLLPLLALALFGKQIFPRYIYSMSLSLIPLSAYGFNEVYLFLNRKIQIRNYRLSLVGLLLAVVISSPLISSIFFVTNPFKANIAEADNHQYVTRWPAGWGVKESLGFFTKESRNKKIFIVTQGTFGLMPYSYEIFLNKNKNVMIKGYWPIEDKIPADVLEAAKKMPTYFVFYQPCPSCTNTDEPPSSWDVRKVFKADKGTLTIYQVLPQ